MGRANDKPVHGANILDRQTAGGTSATLILDRSFHRAGRGEDFRAALMDLDGQRLGLVRGDLVRRNLIRSRMVLRFVEHFGFCNLRTFRESETTRWANKE